MAFIGTPLDTRNTFQSLVGKRFNGDGSTTAFTLDVAPSSTLDIEVFVGNVRQDPNSAYTLSGTTLTFTGAPPSGTNNIYVVNQAKSVGTIDPPATESTAKTFSGGVTLSGTTTHSGALNVTGGLDSRGGAVFNEGSADEDFRVESNGNANAIFVNGGEDTVGIGNSNAHSFADNADNLVVGTGSGHNGITISSDGSSSSSIFFANGTSGTQVQQGQIVYEQNNSTMLLKTANVTAMSIDGTGAVTKPLQPSFNVNSATMNNLAINTTHTVQFNSERFDTNADFNTGTYQFTAPVTGKYQLQFQINIEGMDQDTSYYRFKLLTSNEDYNTTLVDPDLYDQDGTYHLVTYCILADMDANDTSSVAITVTNDGAAQADVSNRSVFSGFLAC